MKDITEKLVAIGAPISQEDELVTLLGSLLRGLATLITAIEAGRNCVSLDYVHEHTKE